MRLRLIAALCLGLFLISGVHGEEQAKESPKEQPKEETKKDEPKKVFSQTDEPEDLDKTFGHEGAGFPFPSTVAKLTRTNVHKYDEEGDDVSASYETGDVDNPMVITVIVFPAPEMEDGVEPEKGKATQLKTALRRIKRDITKAHEGSKLIADEAFTLKENGNEHKGARASYELKFKFYGKMVDAESDMLLFVEGKWLIEYRISYPKASSKAARPVIDEFLSKLAWKSI